MENQILNLLLKIDSIDNKLQIKEELAKILIENDNNKNNENNVIIESNKSCCMPSVCASNCGSCYIHNNLTLPVKKCCVIL